MSDLGSRAQPYTALCGQTLKSPIRLSQDRGFGCLGSLEGMTETVRVWIQPMPTALDPKEVCPAFAEDRSFYKAFSFFKAANSDGGTDGGTDGGIDGGPILADAPQATWAQGSDEGTWRRDVSPCGGAIHFEVTLAFP